MASLCFAELCLKGPGTQLVSLGDLYTFGASRVSRGDFSMSFQATVGSPRCIGSSWRTDNKDYVSKVLASPHLAFHLERAAERDREDSGEENFVT